MGVSGVNYSQIPVEMWSVYNSVCCFILGFSNLFMVFVNILLQTHNASLVFLVSGLVELETGLVYSLLLLDSITH